MKKKFTLILVLIFVFIIGFSSSTFTLAEENLPLDSGAIAPPETLDTTPAPLEPEPEPQVEITEHFSIDNGDGNVLEIDIALPDEGLISITDSSGVSENVDARSVLGMLYALDQKEDSFNITELIYYSSFNAFYLKCISLEGDKKCDYWQYKINGKMASVGMDSAILSGGENIEIYFDDSFFPSSGDSDDEPEVVENRDTSFSGSRTSTTRPSINDDSTVAQATPEPQIIQEETSVEPTIIAMVEVPKIKKAEKVEKEVEVAFAPELISIPDDSLVAAVGESDSPTKMPAYYYIVLAALLSVMLGRYYIVRHK